MKIDFTNCINLVTAEQNAEIVKMVSEGLISSKQAKELLTIIIEENKRQIIEAIVGVSSNGRTADFDSVNRGSSPCTPAN